MQCPFCGHGKSYQHGRTRKGQCGELPPTDTNTRVTNAKIQIPRQAQRFLSTFGLIRGHFHPKQHQLVAQCYRQQLRQRFEEWGEVTCLKPAA